ncbi:TonB-dependent outer membrane receptor, SusC/RagA subfamily, signature region [Mucilaginibacter lappiensis]|uniref:TonB-dependent SusC/RagA subfamily outer membrane receptor n=1 Tax=Mucilaginibacter lappiensis TaxID=354630 RepID=A0ABR6PKJ4_9SPHI|nr:carboxypeptidase-like regulatory domain-containing protein [Mucilaginibacter lappiensis]MBB6110151.1 TonB-dependent SusC/RagA subfamily outer membrane receptor [Mucilaginibacter lappiensis]SIR51647.1 TonB-dependent outer membrane receptor, SusC/RagA subfamily, signature region [Mucilaginibacter lappiensis]
MVSTTYNSLSLSLKIALFILLLIGICISPAFSQKLLSPSRQSSYYTYIYKLSPADVLNFYKHPGKNPDENILHNPIDSFKTDKYWENKLPAGNYLRIHASKNKLVYELIENRSAFLQLFRNNYDLRFILTDKQGQLINNATVQFDQKTVAFDHKSGLYSLNATKKDTILKAEFAGVTNYYKVKQEKPYRYNQYNRQSWFKRFWLSIKNIFKKRPTNPWPANKYQGFMVFNKAMYKPHDTVKFKAYILNKDSKNPINTPSLLVRLKENYNDDGKIIGKVNSYRAGGFEYSFVLNDSLDLSLDNNYNISLEDPEKYEEKDKTEAKHLVYLTGNFRYEEYELKSLTFSARTDKKEHWPGNPLALYLKAVDENNLPSPDGRVTITLTTRNSKDFNSAHVFVPDTLWKHQQVLDPIGETKILIPDSIFPKANIDYRISAEFLNSNNESQSADEWASFKYKRFHIAASLSADTLISTYQNLGKDIKGKALIAALDAKEDTISKQQIILPSKIIINPNATSYSITTDSSSTELELKQEQSGVSLSGYRTADSLFVKVTNTRNLYFWYSVFAGNKLIDAGQAVQLFYKRAYREQNNVTFLINYIWAGQSRTDQSVIAYQDKLLTINVKQPVSVYPGQQVKTDIVVTDATGKPVPNTDITAWAMTSKFTNYQVPYLPYLGKLYPNRKYKNPFTNKGVDGDGFLKLNWNRWSREMGLDSIAYYQFTHPTKAYRVEEPTTDTLAQIAPFIVKDGDVVPVHILYIDNRPVYFDQAQQLQRYSFQVSPGLHSLQFRTNKQLISIDSILVKKSKKLILSINADNVKATKITDTLTAYEADLLNRYMITVVNNFESRMATLEQPDKIMLLNPIPGGYRNDILTGPLADNYAQLSVRGEKPRYFIAEPGYSFLFEPGLIKQKSIPYKYPFNKKLSVASGTDDYTQLVLTKAQTDSLWQQYLDLRANTQRLFRNDDNKSMRTGHLVMNINQPREKRILIKNVIMYRYNDPEFIRIYPGNTTDLYGVEAGNYRLLFLLKGDVYDIKENVSIKPYGTNFYKLTILPSHTKDSVSTRISNIINSRNGLYDYKDRDIENDALKIKEAFNEKYLDMSDFTGQMGGTITDINDKQPLAGVTVKVKGTNNGTVTDINGRFKLKVPAHGKLIVIFIGYDAQEINIVPGAYEKIALKASSKALQEVVVVGYGIQRKANLTGSVSTVLNGRIAGISVSQDASRYNGYANFSIRGSSSTPGQAPLFVVDGVIVENPGEIRADSIADINVLKDAAATALYGSRAAHGVVIINTKKKPGDAQAAESSQPGNEASLRKNFSDYAYWQPKLTTDAQGKASFTTTYPDDITSWRTFIIGINGKQTGFNQAQVKSFKPLSANFTSPQFAVAGDEMSVIGKVLNYNSQTADVNRSFTYNGKLLKQENISVKNSKIDTLNIIADAIDSLSFEYTIKRDNGYFDGERRKIPVIKQGVKETKGMFEVLNGDTTAHLKFDPTLGPITFHAENSVLPALMEETQKLRDYKYLCNEQLASKLKGLLTEKRIKKFLGEDFKYGKNITEVIKKLQENRKSTGTWGWWKDTNEELWISLHAIEALIDAQKEGYTTQLDKQKISDYLVYQLESYRGQDKLLCLQLLHKLGAKVDYKKYFDTIAKENASIKLKTDISVSTYDKFRLMLLKQEAGVPVKLDSLLAIQHRTLFGNVYWGENNYSFFDNSIQLSILAYQIIRNDGKHPDLLNKVRGYFLEQRGHGDWRNTYEAALILETILPDLLVEGKPLKPATLMLKGSKTETISQFPYTATLTDNDISVSKTGTLPVYITGYQQFWNPKPKKVNKDFTVDTWFEKNGEKTTKLKGGESIVLKAEINAKGDADFVMIEIPIPAGCSYNSKEQSWDNNEVHREYFKEKVSIFCRKLKQGKYTYTINLMPRFDGRYNLNPAKAEMMYFPVFYGREGMKKVVIGSQGN